MPDPDPAFNGGTLSTPPKPILPNELQVVMNFLKNYGTEIGTVAAVASTIGIIFAAIGLFATRAQIEDSRKALEATTVYNIQKDAREMLKDLHQTPPEVSAYIAAEKLPENPAPDLVTKAEFKITEVIQFYSAVFNQHRDGVVTGKYWDTFAKEICKFVRLPVVSKFWQERVVHGTYGDEFRRFGCECLERKSTTTP